MKKQVLLFLLFASAVIASAELAVTILTVSPNGAAPQVYWIFYLSLFISLSAVFSLLWYTMKRYFIFRTQNLAPYPSIRQASFLAFLIVIALFLNSLAILTVWDVLPILISLILIEFFFQADKLPSSSSYESSR